MDNIDVDSIYYIEYRDGQVLIHTKEEVITSHTSLLDIKRLTPNNFFYANPNIIVNDDKVIEYDYIDCLITFDNGLILTNLIKKFNIL